MGISFKEILQWQRKKIRGKNEKNKK